jgi:hypothetical protein
MALASAVSVLALAWLGASSLLATSSPTTTTSRSPASTSTTAAPTTTTTTDPGLLPQTAEQPPSDDASLEVRLQPLFGAIQSASTQAGTSVFFPESAYLSMKAGILPSPASDYQSRLIGFYGLDLAAYQQALGPSPSSAQLVAVNADPSFASWIPPGSCENSIGYWHLPNVRLVYTNASGTQSFAVASLISWRGLWYVVHLGPNPRPSDVGTVDQPETGPGAPGPAGGC